MLKLSVHLVAWNGAKYVPYLFQSLRNQSFKEWELLVIDNDSKDETVAAIQKELVDFPVASRIIVNTTNKGFAGGHNQAFKETNAPYILLLNQDMHLAPDCLEKLVAFMEAHSNIAGVSPRLMRWDFAMVHAGNVIDSFTNYVDSFGLKVFKNRRAIEDQATRDTTEPFEVFGISGALPLFRRVSLKHVAFSDGTFFDESYHSYKEDVDLAFRLRSAGFATYIVPSALAYHDRSAAGPKQLSDSVAAKNKRLQSSWVKYHSYKNQIITLYKNEYWQNAVLDFPWIVWYEIKKFVYFLIFEPKILLGLVEVWKMRKELAAKRKQIKSLRKVSWRQIRKWYV